MSAPVPATAPKDETELSDATLDRVVALLLRAVEREEHRDLKAEP
jgi:hypothetical protein